MDRRRAAARANGGMFILTAGAIVLLTAACAVAIHRAAAAGDVASVAFVAVSYGALLLLHRNLGAYETAAGEPENDAAAEDERGRLRRRIWALSTLLTVLFERRRGRAGSGRIKAAVWALTTLLAAMLSYASSGVAPPVVVVGALVLLCLGEFERDHQIGFGGQYAELFKMAFGVMACDSALAHHQAHGDAGSLAFVFVAYVGFLTLTWFFLRSFDGRGRGAGGQ